MTGVWEDPAGLNYETDYQYDVLANLTYVNQKGSNVANARTRSFAYDSLSELTSATNPESGAITYAYDADGNVITKTAPMPNQTGATTVQTTDTYDKLNRQTKRAYNDGSTPAVQFQYDATPALSGCATTPPTLTDSYPVGRRTQMCDGSGGTAWSHDQMGRPLQDKRLIGAITTAKNVDYGYNLDGSVSFITTPPLKSIAYTYNGAARATKAVDNTDSIQFVTGAAYAPPGALTAMTMGPATGFAGFVTTNAFNDRLQPILLSAASPTATVFSECFDFHLGVAVSTTPCSFSASTAGDNGNVSQIVNNRDNTRTPNYTYDSLNRIASAYSSGTQWGETFTTDSWGNLTNEAQISGKTLHEGLNTSAGTNNQLAGFGYDAAGNMTSNGSASYVYDAENRLIWTSGYRYLYDGNGQRVEKCIAATVTTACPTSGTNGTLYWRGTGSETLDETDLSGNALEEYVFFNRLRVARRDVSTNNMHYYFSDHLGSHAVVESATGTTCEQDIDYYPYGGVEHDYCANVAQNYKFNGKERDSESGLDNFGARYNASSLGRFMTPDWSAKPQGVPYAVLGDPQSLNLYAYVGNNPLSRTDPTGHYEFRNSGCGDNAKCQKAWDKRQDKFEKRREKDLNSKKADVRAAAAAYGARGEVNGVHVGFADSKGAYNAVTNPFNSTPGNIDIEVTIDNSRVGSDSQEHEGAHVEDSFKFLNSFSPRKGGYDQSLNPTHGQTEFNGLMVGAEIDHGHGLDPNKPQQIWDFIRNSPVYGPVMNQPMFPPALFPGPTGPED